MDVDSELKEARKQDKDSSQEWNETKRNEAKRENTFTRFVLRRPIYPLDSNENWIWTIYVPLLFDLRALRGSRGWPCYEIYAMLCYAMKWKAILRIEIERQSERESEIAKRNETKRNANALNVCPRE